ncbi:unnamed protein product [Schistosoma curassoni]|uniref:CTNNB1 binding N-teminal domain-containing protein n=1 Tax=Schistosoma curassoni TaxID=6186 RepID=A0A183KQU1_9TREM|nr:unnamed protein product [Schistosoma curassoni]
MQRSENLRKGCPKTWKQTRASGEEKKRDLDNKNVSNASNDNEEPDAILLDADYPSDLLSTDEIFNKSDENVSEESNAGDLISSVVDPHHLVTSSGSSIRC